MEDDVCRHTPTITSEPDAHRRRRLHIHNNTQQPLHCILMALHFSIFGTRHLRTRTLWHTWHGCIVDTLLHPKICLRCCTNTFWLSLRSNAGNVSSSCMNVSSSCISLSADPGNVSESCISLNADAGSASGSCISLNADAGSLRLLRQPECRCRECLRLLRQPERNSRTLL